LPNPTAKGGRLSGLLRFVHAASTEALTTQNPSAPFRRGKERFLPAPVFPLSRRLPIVAARLQCPFIRPEALDSFNFSGYVEIADVAQIPLNTVNSHGEVRSDRARKSLWGNQTSCSGRGRQGESGFQKTRASN
jgi:hypothetical protein